MNISELKKKLDDLDVDSEIWKICTGLAIKQNTEQAVLTLCMGKWEKGKLIWESCGAAPFIELMEDKLKRMRSPERISEVRKQMEAYKFYQKFPNKPEVIEYAKERAYYIVRREIEKLEEI